MRCENFCNKNIFKFSAPVLVRSNENQKRPEQSVLLNALLFKPPIFPTACLPQLCTEFMIWGVRRNRLPGPNTRTSLSISHLFCFFCSAQSIRFDVHIWEISEWNPAEQQLLNYYLSPSLKSHPRHKTIFATPSHIHPTFRTFLVAFRIHFQHSDRLQQHQTQKMFISFSITAFVLWTTQWIKNALDDWLRDGVAGHCDWCHHWQVSGMRSRRFILLYLKYPS